MSGDRALLLHILDCIEHVEGLLAPDADPLSDRTLRDAILRNLQVMAESGSRLSDSFHAAHPQVDWVGLRGFRNRLVHDYLGIDIGIIRRALDDAMPLLKAAVQSALNQWPPL